MKIKFSIIILLFSLFINLNDVNAKTFNAKEFTLKNGLKVIIIPNKKAPVVKQMIWYKAGSIDEEKNKGGLAHLTEHLMFRGTKNIPNNKFNETISQYGGTSNAFTMHDFTSYHQFVDISKLELAMYMEADRMENLNFSKSSFNKEKSIVLQERMQNTDNNPNQVFLERLDSIFWQNNKYSRPVIGSIENIKSLTYKDVMRFYNNHYSPNNAILILSGDIDFETGKKLATKYYGKIENRGEIRKYIFETPSDDFNSALEMENEKITTSKIIKKYIADSYNTNKKNIYALEILNNIISEGENSLLNKKFVIDDKTSIAVGSSYTPYKRGLTSLNIYLIPKDNNKVEKISEELDAFLKKISNKITHELVRKTKDKILASLIYTKDNPEILAHQIGLMASSGMSIEEITNWDKSINDVNYSDVKRVAESIFNEKTNITGIIKPKVK
jgi:zinc protease